MSSIEVKEIVYHCACRRFVKGTPSSPSTCFECGREHAPTEEYGSAIIPAMEEYALRTAENEAPAECGAGIR